MSVNSKMTAIANATRALDGSTAALTLDGIASKLGVEKTNIAAALAAIAEKGVEVPSGSTSDALASLIASIEAGGGGGDILGLPYTCGKFTLTEDTTTQYTIAGSGDLSAVLFDGETFALVLNKMALFVWKTPGTENVSLSNYQKTLLTTMKVPDYVTSTGAVSGISAHAYTDNYGTILTSSGLSTGAYVYSTGIHVKFTTIAKGSAAIEYSWLLVRCLQ